MSCFYGLIAFFPTLSLSIIHFPDCLGLSCVGLGENMQLYSKQEWVSIPWPSTEEGGRLRSFFEPMFQEGTNAFVANVESQVYILHIDDLFIPVTVNEREYRNSYVCSMYSFLLYTEEEMTRHRKYVLRFFLYPFLTFLKLWFR